MGDYESGYDPKYGYNRNAFAHGTTGTAVMGRIVKLIVTPIGLGSEAIHHYRDKKKLSASQPEGLAPASTPTKEKAAGEDSTQPSGERDFSREPVFVEVPIDQAEELIASHQAVPTNGEKATHKLVLEGTENDDLERDEAAWALDEAASEVEETNADKVQQPGTRSPVSVFPPAKSKNNNCPKTSQPKNLPFPLILPQRRPGTKTRGFIRAYAPALRDSGIDQVAFLQFLKDFHKAAQASPIFQVVMIATAIAGAYPDIMVGLAVQAVQIASGIGQEIQERFRTNKFLDQANKEIFMPKGLFTLIVTYKTSNNNRSEVGTETVDMGASAMAKYGDSLIEQEKLPDVEIAGHAKKGTSDELKEKMKQLRIASGETNEAQMPVMCAPLTFPALDAIADTPTREAGSSEGIANSVKVKAKDSSKFVDDYFDRRAQATYAANNPKSTLTSQMAPAAPQFKSRFADPNNATNMHFFTLITGGLYKAEPLGARRRYERAQRKAEEQRSQGVKEKGSKRFLQEGVLYLMVVNMPTEQELEKARKEIREAKERKKAEKKKDA